MNCDALACPPEPHSTPFLTNALPACRLYCLSVECMFVFVDYYRECSKLASSDVIVSAKRRRVDLTQLYSVIHCLWSVLSVCLSVQGSIKSCLFLHLGNSQVKFLVCRYMAWRYRRHWYQRVLSFTQSTAACQCWRLRQSQPLWISVVSTEGIFTYLSYALSVPVEHTEWGLELLVYYPQFHDMWSELMLHPSSVPVLYPPPCLYRSNLGLNAHLIYQPSFSYLLS